MKEHLFAVIPKATREQPNPVGRTHITFTKLMDEIVTYYQDYQPPSAGGAHLAPPRLQLVKIYMQGSTYLDPAKRYRKRELESVCVECKSVVLTTFEKTIKPSLNDYAQKREELLKAALAKFDERRAMDWQAGILKKMVLQGCNISEECRFLYALVFGGEVNPTDKQRAQQAGDKLYQRGFTHVHVFHTSSDGWKCHVSKVLVPATANLATLFPILTEVADEFDGVLDAWAWEPLDEGGDAEANPPEAS